MSIQARLDKEGKADTILHAWHCSLVGSKNLSVTGGICC